MRSFAIENLMLQICLRVICRWKHDVTELSKRTFAVQTMMPKLMKVVCRRRVILPNHLKDHLLLEPWCPKIDHCLFCWKHDFYELSMIICRWKHHDVSKFPLGSMYIMIDICGGRRGWIDKFKWDDNLWKVRQLTGNMYTCMYTSLLIWKKMKLAHISFSSLVHFFCSLSLSLSIA